MKSTIDRLIINSPYEEPVHYWSYDRETRFFSFGAAWQWAVSRDPADVAGIISALVQ